MWSWLAVSLSGIGAIAGTKHGHIGQALSYKVFTFVLLATIALTQSVVADFTYWVVAGLASRTVYLVRIGHPIWWTVHHAVCFAVAAQGTLHGH